MEDVDAQNTKNMKKEPGKPVNTQKFENKLQEV